MPRLFKYTFHHKIIIMTSLLLIHKSIEEVKTKSKKIKVCAVVQADQNMRLCFLKKELFTNHTLNNCVSEPRLCVCASYLNTL